MTAIAERSCAPRASRLPRPRLLPEGRSGDGKGERVELERLHPRLRGELGLPEPEPNVAALLERLRLR